MREEVETLKDHTDFGTLLGEHALRQRSESAARLADTDPAAFETNLAGVDRFQQGETAKHRTLARSRGSQHCLDIAAVDAEAHAAKHLVAAVALVDIDGLEDVLSGSRF